jgi:hypothetical protein
MARQYLNQPVEVCKQPGPFLCTVFRNGLGRGDLTFDRTGLDGSGASGQRCMLSVGRYGGSFDWGGVVPLRQGNVVGWLSADFIPAKHIYSPILDALGAAHA